MTSTPSTLDKFHNALDQLNTCADSDREYWQENVEYWADKLADELNTPYEQWRDIRETRS